MFNVRINNQFKKSWLLLLITVWIFLLHFLFQDNTWGLGNSNLIAPLIVLRIYFYHSCLLNIHTTAYYGGKFHNWSRSFENCERTVEDLWRPHRERVSMENDPIKDHFRLRVGPICSIHKYFRPGIDVNIAIFDVELLERKDTTKQTIWWSHEHC